MKKAIFIIIFILTAFFAIGEEVIKTPEQEQEEYEYNNLVTQLTETTDIPAVTQKYITFTHDFGARFAGIAFDFEGYRIVHPFQNRINTDYDDNVTSRLMFFILARSYNKILSSSCRVRYILIIDGLWTIDTHNPNSEYDPNTGLSVSYIDIKGEDALPPVTKVSGNNVTFIYHGKSGQSVRLTGSFCAWDSWIYTLKENAENPGLYELTLTLPRGKYYYSYYIGMQPLIDDSNSAREYTSDGRTLSTIIVE